MKDQENETNQNGLFDVRAVTPRTDKSDSEKTRVISLEIHKKNGKCNFDSLMLVDHNAALYHFP